MLAGELYTASASEIQAGRGAAQARTARFKAAHIPLEQRYRFLQERLAAIGPDSMIRPPFHCDYGFNVSLAGVFLNFNCIILDVVEVVIGDGTQIGPAVQIYAADHPRDAETRKTGLEFGRPVRIGKDVWIGGGAIILPGITIGDGAVIGAGSVVTRDVGPGVTVAGNPARPRRID
jgi:maltose O-acetyltransferase